MGGIIRRVLERDNPAPFFWKIRDYPEGYRVLGCPLATQRRKAISMGLDPELPIRDVQEEYEKRINYPIKPLIVRDGPCKENILKEEDVNLYHFPAPTIHEGDGGRYIGTCDVVIVKDPDSDWTNWGMYRVMIHNKNHVSFPLHVANQAGKIFRSKYSPRNKAMPVAIVLGADPLCFTVAATRFEAGMSEVEYAGALKQEPVELLKCETSNLLVPAQAEIVLEGEVLPDLFAYEAPFGEYTGYRTSHRWSEVCVIKAVTHRDNPILTVSNPGIPGRTGTESPYLARVAAIKKALLGHGIPFTDVQIPVETASFLVVVSVKRSIQANIADQIWNVISAQASYHPMLLVVEEDVDIYNIAEVLHALATRCHPARGIRINDHDQGAPLYPYLTNEEKKWLKGASVLFDCTWPVEWAKETDIPPRISFKEAYPENVKQKIIGNWDKWGFK